MHTHADNFVRTFWDDGTNIMGQNGYEVYDEASQTSSNHSNCQSSWSGYGAYEWSWAEETASTLNIDVADLTPDAFNDTYAEVYARDSNAADALADTSAANSFGSTGCLLLLISSLLSMSGGGLLW